MYSFKLFISVISSFLILSCSSEKDEEIGNNNPIIEEEKSKEEDKVENDAENEKTNIWSLAFEENFDTNLDQWNIWQGGAFNNEIQLYQKEQLTIADGILSINAKRENITGVKNPFETDIQKSFSYVSGRIESKTQFGPSDVDGEQIYKIVAKIKLPKGLGMWPAFWTFSDPWPTKGEIDILEARGNKPTQLNSNIFYGSQSGKSSLKQKDTKKTYNLSVDLTNDFHEYELIWQKSGLEIKLDGSLIQSGTKTSKYIASTLNGLNSFYGSKHQIVLNLAVGGVFFNNINPTTFVDQATMEIDWVRVYKKSLDE